VLGSTRSIFVTFLAHKHKALGTRLRKVALVNLYIALGGGWKLGDVDWVKSPASDSLNPTNP
jgi:hypothetical protein